MKNLDIVAVVVTYKWLALLTKAIKTLKNQKVPVRRIIVINNGSTDNIARWLDGQKNLTVIHQSNIDASCGVAMRIKLATAIGEIRPISKHRFGSSMIFLW